MSKKYRKYTKYYGIYGIEYISHGCWADAEIIYKGYLFNEPSIGDAMWGWFLEIHPEYHDSDAWTEPCETEFAAFMRSELKSYLMDCIYGQCYEYRVQR